MSDKKIYKPKPISGFPEWLPEERLVEQRWMDHIREVFESYGFCNIETPSVEELDVITAKGEVDKEIYVIERLHKETEEEDYVYTTEPRPLNPNDPLETKMTIDGVTYYIYKKNQERLALHFDQTVPMARYVAMHFNDLTFPFKRYQMQRVWRGERPQMGRMREFYQCDIDIINVDNLPISFDAEVAAVMYEVLEGLDIGRVQLRINNRKILMGLLEFYKIDEVTRYTRLIDKLEKLGRKEIEIGLKLNLKLDNLDENLADDFLKLISIKGTAADVRSIESKNEAMKEGIEELAFVLDNLSHLPEGAVVADLSIVRGLDYYTGTVYETQLLDVPEFTGSVCSGGRYDDLAGSYINKHLPGVGISIGFSRLFDVMRQTRPEKLGIGPKCPTDVLVVLPNEEQRAVAAATARTLRENGYNVELYHAPQKLQKQLGYAEKKGIPYVWFPPFDADGEHEVKDMNAKTQTKANPEDWKGL